VRKVEEDDVTIYQCEAFLNQQKPESVLEGDRDRTAYLVAATFGDYGAGYETRLEYLAEWNAKCCVPPLDQAQVEKCARSGGTSRQTAIGSKHPTVLAEGLDAYEIDEPSPELAAKIEAHVRKLEDDAKAAAKEAAAARAPLILSSAEFVKDFEPPEYVVKGLLRRRFAYAITARTGDGKTAICLLLVACVDQGTQFAGHEIKRRGLCLYFAGENPDDIRMRWLAMTREMGLTPEDFNVKFVPGIYKLSEIKDRIRQEVGEEDVALVVIDTSAAYFPGSDENNNVELGNHARTLRKQFVELPGGPCVVICCHPIKHAADDNLQPRGGGAYVAELDGNLTVIKQDTVAELHWQTKFRGPNFAPLTFQFKTITDHPLLKDSDGDPLPTVVALALSEQETQRLVKSARKDEDLVLVAIWRHVGASQADLGSGLN
jgi:AAA domain